MVIDMEGEKWRLIWNGREGDWYGTEGVVIDMEVEKL